MALEDKVCVVTGASGGIGRSTAIEMGKRGAKVVVTDVNDDGGAETVSMVEGTGAEAIYIHCDVRDEDEVIALMKGTADRFGGIDVVHNNAGVHETDFTSEVTIDTLPLDVWTKVYEINLRGMWFCTKHSASYLRESKRGPNIVNAASIGGLAGYPMGSAYCSTKGAVLQLTRCTAVDLGPDVRANCYCPGSVDTPMVAKYIDAADDRDAIIKVLSGTHIQPRLGEPEEVANLVCFLASDEASFITGATFTIDGGAMAWRGQNS